jgi:PleD family two-component response regulator
MATKHTVTTPVADILVVDDEIASLKLLAEILTQAGYRVRPAERPQLALESALAHLPSLIILSDYANRKWYSSGFYGAADSIYLAGKGGSNE